MVPPAELLLFGFKVASYVEQRAGRDEEGRKELLDYMADQAALVIESIEKMVDRKIEAALKEVREEWSVMGDRLWDGS